MYLIRIQSGLVNWSGIFNHLHSILPKTLSIKSLKKTNNKVFFFN